MFSAILTAFNVESYKLLRPSPDNTAISLQRIAMQLQSVSTSTPFVNATHSAISDMASIFLDTPSPIVPEYVVKLNTLWFSSLILSLHSTIIGIFVKQWTGEYGNGLAGSSRVAARLRQYRLNNLLKWRVGHIIAIIPILLIISVALFLTGILVLLQELNPTVARVAWALVSVGAVSATFVTLLPLFKTGCAYISPQARLLLFLWQCPILPVLRLVFTPVTLLLYIVASSLSQLLSLSTGKEHQYVANTWMWLWGQLYWFSPHPRNWRAEEEAIVNSLQQKLDVDTLITWYDTTLHIDAVCSASVCLLDQGSDFVLEYFSRLHKTVMKRNNIDAFFNIFPANDRLVWQVLLCAADMGGMGLLQNRRLFDLASLKGYLSTDSEHLRPLVRDVAGGIRTAVTAATAKSGYNSRAGPAFVRAIKKIPLVTEVGVDYPGE